MVEEVVAKIVADADRGDLVTQPLYSPRWAPHTVALAFRAALDRKLIVVDFHCPGGTFYRKALRVASNDHAGVGNVRFGLTGSKVFAELELPPENDEG